MKNVTDVSKSADLGANTAADWCLLIEEIAEVVF